MNILILLVVEGGRATLGPCRLHQLHRTGEMVSGPAGVFEDVSFTYQRIEVQDLGTGAVAVDDWNSPV